MTERNEFLPFALPDIGDEEIAAATEALRSGWVTTGPRVKEFERVFAERFGDGCEAIAVNSATAGLHLALEAIGVGPGDEVITSTLTFTATAEVVRYLGADPRFVDIDPDTLNLDPQQLEAVITPRTKAIMPVHYAGLACDMDAISDIAKRHSLAIVEDAAHALPATWRGKAIGSLPTDACVFSFYANKTITTGEGGLIVTRNAGLAKRMRIMRLHGMNRDAFDRYRSQLPSWDYEIVAPGFKYNLTDIAAAIGLVQLHRLPSFAERRRSLARRYFEELADLPLVLPAKPQAGDEHAWHLFVVRLADDCRMARDTVIEALSKEGIGTSVHYRPLHRHPYWHERYQLTSAMFPNAEKAFARMLSIPLYTAMSDADQERVIRALREILA